VILLNPEYHCDFTKKKQMCVKLNKEFLLPIPANRLGALVGALQLQIVTDFDRLNPKEGGQAFNIRTGHIVLVDIEEIDNACSVEECNGRHPHGGGCAFPISMIGKTPCINYACKIRFPEYEQLGEVEVCCSSFARLFCEAGFLSQPSKLQLTELEMTGQLVTDALQFYHTNNYIFEVAGLGYGFAETPGENGEQGVVNLTKVKAKHFAIHQAGPAVFDRKITPAGLGANAVLLG
jgi:hypothetical protein